MTTLPPVKPTIEGYDAATSNSYPSASRFPRIRAIAAEILEPGTIEKVMETFRNLDEEAYATFQHSVTSWSSVNDFNEAEKANFNRMKNEKPSKEYSRSTLKRIHDQVLGDNIESHNASRDKSYYGQIKDAAWRVAEQEQNTGTTLSGPALIEAMANELSQARSGGAAIELTESKKARYTASLKPVSYTPAEGTTSSNDNWQERTTASKAGEKAIAI